MTVLFVLAWAGSFFYLRGLAAAPEPVYTVESEIVIEASPDVVWEVLSDFEAYSDWNPYAIRLEGEAAPGQVLTLEIVQANWPKPRVVRPRLRCGRARAEARLARDRRRRGPARDRPLLRAHRSRRRADAPASRRGVSGLARLSHEGRRCFAIHAAFFRGDECGAGRTGHIARALGEWDSDRPIDSDGTSTVWPAATARSSGSHRSPLEQQTRSHSLALDRRDHRPAPMLLLLMTAVIKLAVDQARDIPFWQLVGFNVSGLRQYVWCGVVECKADTPDWLEYQVYADDLVEDTAVALDVDEWGRVYLAETARQGRGPKTTDSIPIG